MPVADTKHVDLPVPDFYRAENAERWDYRLDQERLFEDAVAWRKRHGLEPAATDAARVELLLIDVQKDFCFPEGSLFVGGRSGMGAIRDNDRTARFIYRSLGVISEITCTMDTHQPHQIFSPSFWLTEDGSPPGPHREVTADDVRSGRLRPDPALADNLTSGDYERLRRQVIYYCEQLEASGKYALYLWPPHCLLGSDGHTLAGVIHEARLFHAFARAAPSPTEIKGDHPLTENYSALAPEVRTWFDGASLGHRTGDLLDRLRDADAIIVAGQAASHCVKHTLDDLLQSAEQVRADEARGPEGPSHAAGAASPLARAGERARVRGARDLARKVYILRDCMSSVAVPDPERPGEFAFDFTPQADAAFERFSAAGMNVVESTTPIQEWLSLG